MLEDRKIETPLRRPGKLHIATTRKGVHASTTKSDTVRDGAAGRTIADHPSIMPLLPIMSVVLIAFLVIGLALPVLPLHVHQGLGLSTFVVGLITGRQFAASLISRVWSGYYAGRKGAKRAVAIGLLTAVAGGMLYLLSLGLVGISKYCSWERQFAAVSAWSIAQVDFSTGDIVGARPSSVYAKTFAASVASPPTSCLI